MSNLYTTLARKTLEMYLKNGSFPNEKEFPKELLDKRAGCFVSLHNKTGNTLRGCIGTIEPVRKNLADEIVHNAISAAREDPRFYPVEYEELKNIAVNVDVLSEPEKIESKKDLNVKKYGVIVRAPNGRSGVLLPDLDGVDSINQQVSIALQKAGIDEGEKFDLYRFTVDRYEE